MLKQKAVFKQMRLPLLANFVFLVVMLSLLTWSFHLGSYMVKHNTPLIEAALQIKLETTTAHLYLEEILVGDRNEDEVSDVHSRLDRAQWYTDAMLNGGKMKGLKIEAIEDEILRRQLLEVRSSLEQLREATDQRLEAKTIAGTEMDQLYDQRFDAFLAEIEEVRTALESRMHQQLSSYQITKYILLGLTFVLFSVYLIMMYRYQADRIKSLQALEASNQLAEANLKMLNTTMRCMGDGLITTDAQGKLVVMNAMAEKLTGWRQSEALGQELRDIFKVVDPLDRSPMDDPVTHMKRSDQPEAYTAETILISQSEQEYHLTMSCAPVLDAQQQQQQGMVLVFHDATEEKAMETQLRQNQKLDAIGQLAGGIAHDFNNVLGGIMGCNELLQLHLSGDQEAMRYLEMIDESGKKAAGLADRLLSFSRKESLSLQNVDLHHVVSDIISILKSTIDKRIVISDDLKAERVHINGESAQLHSVFLNMGINASQAMPDGGNLSFSSKLTTLSRAFCRASAFELEPGDYICIEVRDTGCGISSEHMDRIFEPFFTTKAQGKGTGLGLAAAYSAVQKHHGCIQAYSEVGKGTSFHVYLPLADKLNEQPSPKQTAIKGHGLILLVDDEPVMRTTGKALLVELGYQVVLAEQGRMALELFKERPDEFDLVVLDMIMPEMNGRDCFQALRAIRSDIPVLLASGFSRDEDLTVLRQQGLNGFIRKPYRSVEFSHMVAYCLGRNTKALEAESLAREDQSRTATQHNPTQDELPQESMSAKGSEEKGHVLLIDDDPIFTSLLKGMFKDESFKFSCYSALEEIREMLPDLNPDLIISDIHLPDGDGREFLTQAIEQGLKSQIIVVSGDNHCELNQALSTHVKHLLQKPVELLAMKQIVLNELSSVNQVVENDYSI